MIFILMEAKKLLMVILLVVFSAVFYARNNNVIYCGVFILDLCHVVDNNVMDKSVCVTQKPRTKIPINLV